jgi:hypothetical protein
MIEIIKVQLTQHGLKEQARFEAANRDLMSYLNDAATAKVAARLLHEATTRCDTRAEAVEQSPPGAGQAVQARYPESLTHPRAAL